MPRVVKVVPGGPPWSPAPGTALIRELHRYDIPLVGILEQGTCRHLFMCLAGEVERASLWGYRLIGTEDEQRLNTGQGASLDKVLEEIGSRGYGILAAAVDDRIVAWATPEVDIPLEKAVEALANQAILALQDQEMQVKQLAHLVTT